ncbi:unnamed protein product [Adineta steineri]|uniref:ADAM10 endopeptidase n=1 Tax=Adineta steineri TaxID=433720 RepID=A0A814B7V7_9BILA|nr:unnamed protein product [Adineta steineri]CAF0923152.1 unnamed protein product [Adineta steineri]
MPWSLILLFFLAILWPYQYFLVHADHLSSSGIERYNFIRKIHDETTADHHRRKRSIIENNPDRILTLELDHKNITLVLKNTNEFFATDADIHLNSSNFIPIDSSILYDGYVLGHDDQSYVSGGFYSNWFDGTIKMSNETWHIEPTRKYGEHLADAGPSIIYNALDVDMTRYNSKNPFRSKRFVMNEDGDDDDHDDTSSFCGLDKNEKRNKMKEESDKLNTEKYDDMDFKSRYTRSKRQTTNKNERERTCCYIYIRVDPTLWDVVYKNEGLNEKEPTIHAIVTFLYRTVTAANAIYRSLKFESNGDVLYRFTLRIKRIRILTPDDCGQKNLSLSETNICRSFLDSNVLLTWHSAENFADYCLAYIFAARDFGDGTLGLAWMGSVASNSRGGICEKPAKDIYEGQRVMKTLNTGMITVINHNTRTSSLMTELTFAHEVGHNLGAEHDDEKCGGDATNGHYIMYRRATTGLEENNNKFSNCSMDKMGPVVIAVKNQLVGKVNCLTECLQVGYCGNRNVEDDEECDCGFISECTDDCCYPAGGPDAKLGCKLKPGARCSPSKGPCCSDQCSFHPSTHICHKDKASQDCIGDVRCDGIQATCPLNDTQFFKPIDTPCNQHTQLCDRGECNKSICTLIDKTECTLTIPNVEDPLRQRGIDREYLCHIGCFETRTNSCVDTLTLRMPNNYSKNGFGYKHRPGHACAGTAGYCDVFGKCRAVDAEGPLTRLKNMLLNEENIRTLTQLIQEYWWAFVLGLLGVIGFMSIFVKICSVHTPSSNPRFKPARSLSLKRGSHGPRPHNVQNSRQPTSTSVSATTGSELTSLQQQQSKRQPKVFVRGSNSSDKQQIRVQQNKNKASRL